MALPLWLPPFWLLRVALLLRVTLLLRVEEEDTAELRVGVEDEEELRVALLLSLLPEERVAEADEERLPELRVCAEADTAPSESSSESATAVVVSCMIRLMIEAF